MPAVTNTMSSPTPAALAAAFSASNSKHAVLQTANKKQITKEDTPGRKILAIVVSPNVWKAISNGMAHSVGCLSLVPKSTVHY